MSKDPKIAVLILTAPPPGATGDEGAFVKVDGRECLLRSADMYVHREDVTTVLTTFPPEAAPEKSSELAGFDLKKRFGGHLAFSGVKLGESAAGWYEQIAALSPKLGDDVTHVLVHDAARVAVAFSEIDALIEAARETGDRCCALGAELDASLVETDGQGHPLGYRPAEAFRLLLWPRVYPRTMLPALARGNEPPAERVRLVGGLPYNIRCNTAADAKRVTAMLKLRPEPKREAPLSPFEEAQW